MYCDMCICVCIWKYVYIRLHICLEPFHFIDVYRAPLHVLFHLIPVTVLSEKQDSS